MRHVALVPLLLAVACGDPVRSSAIDKLGGEAPGVKPGPLHRPGQPCVLCHDGNGPGNISLLFGGTVYQMEGPPAVPAVGAIVHFRDSLGADYRTLTNCAGNFFVVEGDYNPTWPVFVKTEYAVEVPTPGGPQRIPLVQPMTSPLYDTDGSTVAGLRRSCASCHVDPPGATTVGHIYLAGTSPMQIPFPPVNCQ